MQIDSDDNSAGEGDESRSVSNRNEDEENEASEDSSAQENNDDGETLDGTVEANEENGLRGEDGLMSTRRLLRISTEILCF